MSPIKQIEVLAEGLAKPENYYEGLSLPDGAALPDNIVCFYHTWIYPGPLSHARWVLVIPFRKMLYMVDNARIELDTGSALLVHPYETRLLQGSGNGFGRLFVTFDLPAPQAYLPSALSMIGEAEYALLETVVRSYEDGNAWECSVSLWHLLECLSHRTASDGISHKLPEIVGGVIRYVNNNLSRMFSISEVADSLHVSESNLRLIFRRETKQSLGAYISEQRMSAAKHRLSATPMSIGEVAMSCGYDTIYAFSRAFKKNVGITPTHYRATSKD